MLRSTCSLLVGRSPLAHYLQRPIGSSGRRIPVMVDLEGLSCYKDSTGIPGAAVGVDPNE